MENNRTHSMNYLDLKTSIINELNQAKELLIKQFQINLDANYSTKSNLLLPVILYSLDNCLSLMSGINFEAGSQPQATGVIESSGPAGGNQSPVDCPSVPVKKPSKERKSQLKWTKQVRVCKQKGLQVSLDDGYNWKKYGQKDILRAKHPRSYYRCSRSSAAGCKAMKQVQQSDEDRSMFIVTYQGKHTCMQAADLVAMQQDEKELKEPQETIISIETPDSVRNQEVPGSPSFSFPPIVPGIQEASGNNNFSLMTLDNHSTSSPFSGPAASESSSFSIYDILNNSEGRHNLPTSEYDDLCELTSATSALDPTEVYLDLDSYV